MVTKTKLPLPTEKQTTAWAKYDAMESGLRNYWYPVLRTKAVGSKPISIKLFDEQIMFVRDRASGKVFAVRDRCLHRGTPLSFGMQDFPGTFSCIYHGWCYDLATGELRAALTDGPNCRIAGKVRIRTYPVEERAGLVFIYMGEGPPPPVEEDIPEELLEPGRIMCYRITVQAGNWRFAVENHFDDAHAQYLHRSGIFSFFWHIPAYKTGIKVVREGKWLDRQFDKLYWEADYPGLGHWPKVRWWKRRGYLKVKIRMPGVGGVYYNEFDAYKFHVPIDERKFYFVQVLTKKLPAWRKPIFWLQYWLYRRWAYHVQFNNQDVLMTKYSHTGPERLFGPDVALVAWRKMCVSEVRQADGGLTHQTPSDAVEISGSIPPEESGNIRPPEETVQLPA
jgi:phenylpropionate dioxygenase-like ring-hydroxylating dioxygenase large terminal subunit